VGQKSVNQGLFLDTVWEMDASACWCFNAKLAAAPSRWRCAACGRPWREFPSRESPVPLPLAVCTWQQLPHVCCSHSCSHWEDHALGRPQLSCEVFGIAEFSVQNQTHLHRTFWECFWGYCSILDSTLVPTEINGSLSCHRHRVGLSL